MKTPTKSVIYPELKVGDVVHFYGARFEIKSTKIVPETDPRYVHNGDIMSAQGVWIDGAEVRGYFGRNKPNWHFQGNKNAVAAVEI